VIDLEELLRRVIADLDALAAPMAVVGGIAVSVRTEPRFTRDVDLAIAVAGDPEAEAVVSAMVERGWRITATIEHEAAGRLAAVRLGPPEEPPAGRVADLLFASSGIEPEVVAGADELEVLEGLPAKVASIGHLIVLKVLARAEDRPQDAVDLQALLDRAGSEDVTIARQAARLVVERGYHRGKDLIGEIDRLTSPP